MPATDTAAETRPDAAALLAALRGVLPLAERYLKGIPSHPDYAAILRARALVERAEGR